MALRPFGNQSSDADRDGVRRIGQYLGLGTQLAGAVVGFGLLGYWIDSMAHTGSLFTTILLFVGAFGGLYGFIRTVIRLGKESSAEPHDRRDAP